MDFDIDKFIGKDSAPKVAETPDFDIDAFIKSGTPKQVRQLNPEAPGFDINAPIADISDFDIDKFIGAKDNTPEKIKAAFPEPSRVRSPEERDYREFATLHGINPETGGYNVETRLPETMANKAVKSFESGVLQAGAGIAALPGFVSGIDRSLRDLNSGIFPDEEGFKVGKRADGSFKGKGFYGELKRPDGGVSTELSIGTSDVEPGKEVEIPTLVPGLSQEQKDYLLSTKPEELSKKNPQMWDSIAGQAINFAKERKAKGLPYFATNTEQPIEKQNWIDILDGTAKLMKDKAAKKMQTVSGGLDIIDTFKQKGTTAGVEQILYGVINQVPNLATQIAAFTLTGGTGSLAYMGATSAASQYNDVKDNPNMSESEKLANAIGNGAFEIIGEKFGGLAILEKYLGGAGKEAIKKGVWNFIKSIGGDMLKEGGSEGFTRLLQNLTDLFTGNTEKSLSKMSWKEVGKKSVQGIGDATIIGGAMGVGMGGGGHVMQPKISADQRTDLLSDSKNSISSNELEGVPEQKNLIDFPSSTEAALQSQPQTEVPAESNNVNFREMDRAGLVKYIEDRTGESVHPTTTHNELINMAYEIQNNEKTEADYQSAIEEEKMAAEIDKAREVVAQQVQQAQEQQAVIQEQSAITEQEKEQAQARRARIEEEMRSFEVSYQLEEARKLESMSIEDAEAEITQARGEIYKNPEGKNVDELLARIDKLNGAIAQKRGIEPQVQISEQGQTQAIPEASATVAENATVQPIEQQADINVGQKSNNPYLTMPIERVRQDAENGVLLAKEALSQREPIIKEPLTVPEGPGDIPVTSLNIEEALRIMKKAEVDYTVKMPKELSRQDMPTLSQQGQEGVMLAPTLTPERDNKYINTAIVEPEEITSNEEIANRIKTAEKLGVSIYGSDAYLTPETDVDTLSKEIPDLDVSVKDTNGLSINMPIAVFNQLRKHKGFDDRVKTVRVGFGRKAKGLYSRRKDEVSKFMEGIFNNTGSLLSGENTPLKEVASIPGVILENNASVRTDKMNKFQEAIQGPDVRELLQELGIKKISIEPPYKFELSEQGRISLKNKEIHLSADANNPAKTLRHEIGHALRHRVSDSVIKKLMESKHEGLRGYIHLNEIDEVVAESFALGIINRDGILKGTTKESSTVEAAISPVKEKTEAVPSKKAKSKILSHAELRREYYKPGAVRYNSYWKKHYKVLDFKESSQGRNDWNVTVIDTDKDGNPLENAEPRTHSTEPTQKDLRSAANQSSPAIESAKPVMAISAAESVTPALEPAKSKEAAQSTASKPAKGIGLKIYSLKGIQDKFNSGKPESEHIKLEEVKERSPEITAVKRLAETFKIKLTLFKNTGAKSAAFEGIFLNDGKLYVDIDSKANPIIQVAVHELTHQLQKQYPAEWEEFLSSLEKISDKGKLADYIAKRRAVVEKIMPGVKFGDDYFKMEYGADVMGALLSGDEKILAGLHKGNPGIVEKILEILKNIKTVFEKVMGQKLISKDKSAMNESIREVLGNNIDPAIEAAEKFLSGAVEKAGANEAVSGNQEDVLFSPAANEVSSWKENLLKYQLGAWNKAKSIDVCRTSEILKRCGADDLKIVINPSILDKVTVGEHKVPYSQLMKLPEQIHDPIAVFKSAKEPDALVVMTEMKEGDKTVAVAIHLNKKEQHHEVNEIRSIHGREKDEHFINWAEHGMMLYQNTKKMRSWLQSRGLQLPKEGVNAKAIILTESDFVKGESQEDVQFSPGNGNSELAEAATPAVAKMANKVKKATDFAKDAVLASLEKNTNTKTDISRTDLLIKTIMYYARKIPALNRIFDAALNLRDNKFHFQNWIFNSNNGEGDSEFKPVVDFAKGDREEWKKLSDEYLWKRDIDGVGYRVKKSADGKTFEIYNAEGKLVDKGYASDTVAWEEAWRSETKEMIKSGKWSQGAAASVLNLRRILGRSYEMLRNNADLLRKEYDEAGKEHPKLDGVSIFDELNKVGDLRGHFLPRMRDGNLMLWSHKEGDSPRLDTFVHGWKRGIKAAALRREGYTVEMTKSNTPSEEAFGGADVFALNDIINNAMSQIRKSGSLTFEQFGLNGESIDYKLKDDKTEKHFIVSGAASKTYGKMFKEFGGRYYEEGWHFKNADSKFEKTLLSAIAHRDGTASVQINAMGQALAEQVATIIHSHGSRSHKIKRDERKGKDVYLGFETDIIKAVMLTGSSIAGGSAKRIMAREMLESFTGQDLKWAQYKLENLDKDIKPGTKEYSAKISELWLDYEKAVRDRSIESSKQPLAYKEGKEFINDMLRNDEKADRIFGLIKSGAALKYLSGLSSALINMTSLATSVPAVLAADGGINIRSVPRLIISGGYNYVKYMTYHKTGKGSKPSAENEWLFNQITSRGWDTDLQNKDLTDIAMTWSNKAWREILTVGLFGFSVTERLNRATTLAAAYNGMAEKLNEKELTDAKKEELLQKAHRMTTDAHGQYGKENLPAWARGTSTTAFIGKAAYQYQNYMHNYYQKMWELRKDTKALSWMALAPAVIGGPQASPLYPLVQMALQVISSLGGPDDPEEAFYKWAKTTFGEVPGRVARNGLAGFLNINLRGSMAVGSPTDFSLQNLGGVPYSMYKQFGRSLDELKSGDYLRAAENAAPRMYILQSGLKAYREHTEGVSTTYGKPVNWGNERLKSDWTETIIRAAGFNPASLSEKREIQWSEKQIKMKYLEMKSELNDEFKDAVSSGDQAKVVKVLGKMEVLNSRLRDSTVDGVVTPFTQRSLVSTIQSMNRLTPAEKKRAGLSRQSTQSDELSKSTIDFIDINNQQKRMKR